MKIKDIDDWDHFKGDFKGKAAKELERQIDVQKKKIADQMDAIAGLTPIMVARPGHSAIIRNIGINSGPAIVAQQVNSNKNAARHQMLLDAMIFGMGMFPMFGSGYKKDEYAGMKELHNLNELCQHEPIDVGFAKVKMVCKKCDKDL